ncbi:proprotein convertase subtilisin/kexin type 5 [Conger conger]|uniref:proprotein convertase subtilisin/kexin type 5 n=1 Tax=Conger conger TaxID=82655 RepID=UPI002A5AF760|nr:proprotein convertase subtilisin/kexin type 5 [Conger conger]
MKMKSKTFSALLLMFYIGFVRSKPSSLSCPSGQFVLKNQCVGCHPTCTECFGHELFECTACGVDGDGSERFLDQVRCRLHCPRGFYPNRDLYACHPCMPHCELCADPHVCAKCAQNYKLQRGLCQRADCGEGQVEDPDSGECVDCEMGCKTCSPDDPELCSSCVAGYFLYRQRCRRSCPQRTFADGDRGMCVSCPEPCADCRSKTLCLSCQDQHFLSQDGCVKRCPVGSFGDPSSRRCQACHSSCLACHGLRALDCDMCPDGNLPLYGQCPAASCLPGQYYHGMGSECQSCDVSCKTCFGPQALDCSACREGYFLDQEGSCVEHCPPGFFSNSGTGLCEGCSPNCQTCEEASDRCLSCQKGNYRLFLHQGACLSNCPDGFVESAEGRCEACASPCLTCDQTASQCLSCAPGRYLEEGRCSSNCSLGSYAAQDGTCRRCGAHCNACADAHSCYRCSFLYLLLDGECKASCPEGFFEDLDEGRCVPCHSTCGTCSGPLQDDCETCSPQSPKLYEGTCLEGCPTGTYYETSAGECQECDQTCAECSGPQPTCLRCQKGLVLDPNTMLCGVTGDSRCPPRTFLQQNQFTCRACHPHCGSCDGPGASDCLTCTTPRFLHNGSCESECPVGSFSSSEQAEGTELGLCSPCDRVCASCSGASPKDCLTCSSGLLHLLNLCLSHCPTGYYAQGSRCERCDRSCELCWGPGPGSCLACPHHLLELQGTRLCVERCPKRFYQQGHTCQQCHTSCKTCTDGTPQGCLTCDWGSTLQEGICYPRCEERRYLSEEEQCELCDGSCRHCFGPRPDQCLTCPPNSALHALENRCARCCQAASNATDCCLCDANTALCVEPPGPVTERGHSAVNLSTRMLQHTPTALPVSFIAVLGLALAAYGLVQARSRKRLCWNDRYERLTGGGRLDCERMPHGVPDPEDSGDEVDVVYASHDGTVYRRYNFLQDRHPECDPECDSEPDENTHLNKP